MAAAFLPVHSVRFRTAVSDRSFVPQEMAGRSRKAHSALFPPRSPVISDCLVRSAVYRILPAAKNLLLHYFQFRTAAPDRFALHLPHFPASFSALHLPAKPAAAYSVRSRHSAPAAAYLVTKASDISMN